MAQDTYEQFWPQDVAVANATKAAAAGYKVDPNNLSPWQKIGFANPNYTVPPDDDDFFGDIVKIAGLAAAVYTGGAALGAWGGAAAAGGAAAGGAMTASELAMADIALGGLGGSAGAAALGSGVAEASFGSMVSSWVDSGVNAISNTFSGVSDAVSSIGDFFTSAIADSPWGVNPISDGANAALDFGNEAAIDSVATQAADAAGASTNAADFAFSPAQASVANPEVTNLVSQVGTKAPGLIDSVIEWGKNNKALAAGALQLGGGLLKGVGDAAAMDKKIAAEKEIAAGRSPEAILAAQRANAASSGAYGQRLGFQAPSAPRVLRRPDGSIVYAQPGLIAGQMKG